MFFRLQTHIDDPDEGESLIIDSCADVEQFVLALLRIVKAF